MYLFEKLEELIGTEVDLFENRNTGRLELRPITQGSKSSITGRYIGGVGQDYVVIEYKGVGGAHYDAYPFSQIALRDWDGRLTAGKDSQKSSPRSEEPGGSASPQSSGRSRDNDWLQ